MRLISKEDGKSAAQLQDLGRLAEIDNHQLLQVDDHTEQITTFDEVKNLGRWFLQQQYNGALSSDKPLPAGLLARHEAAGNNTFLAKLILAEGTENHFPVTVEIVDTPNGKDLRLHIVPINFQALEVAQFSQHTDSLLALAAAAAIAPQFLLALEGGIATTVCSSKKDIVTSITPDHGTPLAVTFDAFNQQATTLNTAIGVTGNTDLSIKQAAHMHGKGKKGSEMVAKSASDSKIAAGVKVKTLLRSQLNQRHVLALPLGKDIQTGAPKIVSVQESLLATGLMDIDLSLLAAALGFTSQVVGDSQREQVVEKVLSPDKAETPLREVVS